MRDYEVENAKYEAEFAKWKKNPDGDAPEKPAKPVLKQLVLDKFTVESLVRINADNPRGVVLAQDELAGLVTGLGQYKGGKGDDKQTMLSVWAGTEAEVNRVRDKESGGMPLHIPHAFVGVAGMIQPDLLGVLRGDFGRADFVNDGWADRFLIAFPNPLPLVGETWSTVSEELERAYGCVFEKLLALEMVCEPDEHPRPYHLPFSDDARRAWQVFTDTIAAKANGLDVMDSYAGVLSKLRHYGLRFTTLFHCLWDAASTNAVTTATVNGETVERAGAMIDYFDAHGRRCLGVGWADRTTRLANRILAWLIRYPDRKGFTRTEAYRAIKDKGKDVRSSEALAPALRMLVDYNYISPLDRPENCRPGPVPETYSVNALWDRAHQECGPTIPTDRQESEEQKSNSGDCGAAFQHSVSAAPLPAPTPASNSGKSYRSDPGNSEPRRPS